VTFSIPHQQRLPAAIAALGFLFLGVFLLYPLFNVFGASLLDPEGTTLTLANYGKMLSRPFYRAAIANTLGIGAAATVITTLLAVPFAFTLARLPIPGKAAILAMAAMPLVLPSFVSAYAIVLLLGNGGIVTLWLRVGCRAGGWASARSTAPAASSWSTRSLFILTCCCRRLPPSEAVDVSMEEAALGLGSPPGRTVRTVMLPIVLPAILAGALLVFRRTLENFGVPFVLAEDLPIFAVEPSSCSSARPRPIPRRPACWACC
jgi:iron(III) transport system permease protein